MTADTIHDTTQGLVSDIKSGLHGIHGAGEALRGGAMEALDSVFHKKDGEARDRAIFDRGVAEMKGTHEPEPVALDTRPQQQHQAHRASAGAADTIRHARHDPGEHGHGHGHGQGSHFTEIQAQDAAAARAPHHQAAAATAGAEEAEGLSAAKAAWQEGALNENTEA